MERFRCLFRKAIIALWPFTLILTPSLALAGAVYGTVMQNGEPQSTSIQFLNTETSEQFEVGTDDAGQYEVILPPGSYRITSDVGDVSPLEIIVFHGPKSQDIQLQ